jgi:hypothetical protein
MQRKERVMKQEVNCSRCGTEANFVEEQDWGNNLGYTVLIFKCPNECLDHIEVPKLREGVSNEDR